MRVLITGGSSDIGGAIAARRQKLGDEVLVTASSDASLKKSRLEGFAFDLAHLTAAAKALDRMLADGIDALVLNAASRVGKLKRFHEIKEEDVRAGVEANIL